VGCVTADIEKSRDIYTGALGFKNVSPVYSIRQQNVQVCFIETAPNIYLELVQPTGENLFLQKILESKNPYYHTGYLTEDFEGTLKKMLDQKLYLVNQFESEAFGNCKCAFLYTKERHLIELIQSAG
jgi:catechol 2,3-dioxygenase-like lactoylglutathione lyase family enzyme